MYLNLGASYDVRPEQFQSSFDVKRRTWTQYQSVTQFQVSSELQCAQNTVISRETTLNKEGVFYIMNGTDMCIIGTWFRNEGLMVEDATIDTIHHHRCKITRTSKMFINDIQSLFKDGTNWFVSRTYWDFRSSNPFVTQYVYKVINLPGVADDADRLSDCHAHCELHENDEDTVCFFAYIEGDNCLLGNFQSTNTIVSGTANPTLDKIRVNHGKASVSIFERHKHGR